MHRIHMINTLERYSSLMMPKFSHSSFIDLRDENSFIEKFRHFISNNENCFANDHLPGHLTGSALVVSEDFNRVVLTLHGKLKIWVQLGGHADGHHKLEDVALREAKEESGLLELRLVEICGHILPFDLDIHAIPANSKLGEHFHYDVRYLIVSKSSQLIKTEESLDLRWFSLEQARSVTSESSMHRQFDKLLILKDIMGFS